MGDIYEQMMRLDVEVAHHESDLYVPVTPDTERILKAHGMDPRKMKFRDNVTGKPWFDIPFAYTPFYRMRSSKTHPINTSFAKNPRNDYDAREMSVLVKRIQELDKLPLAERKENAAELLDAMQDDLNLIGERLIWLLQGAYGHAEYVKAHEIRKMSKRANRAAQIMQLLAALEWMVPPRLTIATWKKLTKTQQKSLDAMLLEELDGEDWDNE